MTLWNLSVGFFCFFLFFFHVAHHILYPIAPTNPGSTSLMLILKPLIRQGWGSSYGCPHAKWTLPTALLGRLYTDDTCTIISLNTWTDRLWGISVDPYQTCQKNSEQGLHCLPFSGTLTGRQLSCWSFRMCTIKCKDVRVFRIVTEINIKINAWGDE